MQYPSETPRWRRYLRFLRDSIRGDVDEELRFHLDSRVEDLVAQGLRESEARERALLEFGDVTAVRRGLVAIDDRLARRRRRAEWLDGLASDVSYAIRSLRLSPAVALSILATLALGVGANAAMFTLLDSIFLRQPEGVVAPENVRRIWAERRFRAGTQLSDIFSYVAFDAIRTSLADRARVAAYRLPEKTKVGLGERAGEAQVSYANPDYLALLGVRASVGRLYSADEARLDSPTPVVVLSNAYWKRAFGGDPNAIGKTIILSGRKFTIIGVAARSFTGTELNAADAWAPLSLYAMGDGSSEPWWTNSRIIGLFILLRPAAGVSDPEIEQRITATVRNSGLLGTNSLTVARLGSIVESNGPGNKSQEENIAMRLAGVAIIVLIIACANVVNLLLARAVRRRREIAVRLALGISRGRLVRLLMVESAVLAAAAAAIATMVAYWGGALLRGLLLPNIHWAQSPLDWRVVLFALAAALVCGLVAGLIPALQAANPELTSALKVGAGSGVVQHSRLRASLVVAQSALSLLLLVGGMLFVQSLRNVRQVDIGYDPSSFVAATVSFDDRTRRSDPTFAPRLAELAEPLSHLPGVEHVGFASQKPMDGFSTIGWYTDSDSSAAHQRFMATATGVAGDYFAAGGIRVLRGKVFPATLAASPGPVVVVSEAMAKTVWPGRSALGQCIRFEARTNPCYRVIGIVENTRLGDIIEPEETAQYYLPLANMPKAVTWMKGDYIAMRVAPEHFAGTSNDIRALIRQQFPGGIPVITRLGDYIEPQYRPWRLGALLFTAFGVLALVVAVVGIYGTVSYSVTQRVHEFGVRIALGATMNDVLRLVIGTGIRVVSIGVAIGLVLALVAGRVIASLLYGISPSDPVVLGSVALILLGVGTLAALAPAWRAARVDPVTALRTD